jgi:hypothetical protein
MISFSSCEFRCVTTGRHSLWTPSLLYQRQHRRQRCHRRNGEMQCSTYFLSRCLYNSTPTSGWSSVRDHKRYARYGRACHCRPGPASKTIDGNGSVSYATSVYATVPTNVYHSSLEYASPNYRNNHHTRIERSLCNIACNNLTITRHTPQEQSLLTLFHTSDARSAAAPMPFLTARRICATISLSHRIPQRRVIP